MKNSISRFISNCRDLFYRQKFEPAYSAQESFQKSYLNSLKYVEKYGSCIAYDSACDWEESKSDERLNAVYKTLEKQGIESKSSLRHEMDRRRRAEELIEMGKSYSPPAAENCPQRDGPELGDD
jgi:hypothetical protein